MLLCEVFDEMPYITRHALPEKNYGICSMDDTVGRDTECTILVGMGSPWENFPHQFV